jgi:hypothetical protein
MTIMSRGGARFWWKEELPKHVLYLYKDDFGGKWTEYTRAENNAKKKEKQEANISNKRYCHKRVPCFIHVFYLDTEWFFGGYFYAVIWTTHGMWYLNWKVDRKHSDFLPRIKNHFTLGFLSFVDDQIWLKEFCKKYPMKPKGIQRPRGKYLTHCIIDSWNNLIDIDL